MREDNPTFRLKSERFLAMPSRSPLNNAASDSGFFAYWFLGTPISFLANERSRHASALEHFMDYTQLEKHAELHSRLGDLIHSTILSLICFYANANDPCFFHPAVDTLPNATESTLAGEPNAGDTATRLLAIERARDAMSRESRPDGSTSDFWVSFWKSVDTFNTKDKIEPISYNSYRKSIFESSDRLDAAITRTDRIDERYAVVPPDEQARYCLIKNFLEQELKKGRDLNSKFSQAVPSNQKAVGQGAGAERTASAELAGFLASKTSGWVVKELQLLVASLAMPSVTGSARTRSRS
jgi:hypothetical protein